MPDTNTNTSGSFKCTFPDGGDDVDRVGATRPIPTATRARRHPDVAVANVAPTVVLSGADDLSVDEGSTHTYSFTVSDPAPTPSRSTRRLPDCDAGATNNGSYVSG